jgi:CheY-like chemotaxis protein
MLDWRAISGSLTGVRVLLVDDDPDTLELYCFLLQMAGATAECSPSGLAALATIESFRPHVLLSDLAMPGIDGLALIRMVRGRADEFRTIPAIAFTAHAREETLREATETGFDRAFTKPVAPVALVAAIRDVLPAAAAVADAPPVERLFDLTLFLTKGSPASQAARESLASIVLEVEPSLRSFETRDLSAAQDVTIPAGTLGDAVLMVKKLGEKPVFIVDGLRSRADTLFALHKAGIPAIKRHDH